MNGLQQSILFHVYDCKLRHKDPNINDSFIGLPREEYQIVFEDGSVTIQVKHRKFHKYLGMTLDYSTVGQVNITMLDYIDEILDAFDKEYPAGGGTKSSAAPAITFRFYKDCKNLNSKQAVEFHYLVEKILFATKWARLYTCTAISFLTTRVR